MASHTRAHLWVKRARACQRPLPLLAGYQSAARGLSQVNLPKGGVDYPQQVFSKKPGKSNFLGN